MTENLRRLVTSGHVLRELDLPTLTIEQGLVWLRAWVTDHQVFLTTERSVTLQGFYLFGYLIQGRRGFIPVTPGDELRWSGNVITDIIQKYFDHERTLDRTPGAT